MNFSFYENSNKNINFSHSESLNKNDPNKIQHIILKVVNLFLLIPLQILFISFVTTIFFTFFAVLGASTADDINVKEYLYEIGGILILIPTIVFLIIVTFNILMGIYMYKRNKNNKYVGKYKRVKKIIYVLFACFLGIFGIHRFIIGDNKGGIIRLIIILIIPIIFSYFFSDYISFIIAIECIMISYSLSFSDFVIGLSKVSDENKEISF